MNDKSKKYRYNVNLNKPSSKIIKKPVFAISMGGLGNQMFIFATGLILANKMNRKFYIVNYWFKRKQRQDFLKEFERSFELAKFPKIKDEFILRSSFLNYLIFQYYKLSVRVKKWFNLAGVCDLDINYVPKSKSFIWYGNMQSDRGYEESKNVLRSYFKLDQEFENLVLRSIRKFKYEQKEIVAIHVRRGDTLVPGNISNVLPDSYFKKSVSHFDLSKFTFLVFSDDIPWCQKFFLGPEFNFVHEQDPVISLRIMNLCDHYILSSSTFGWWGAWLTHNENSMVLYPKVTDLGKNTLIEPFHRDNWIGIETYFENLI